MLFFLSDFSSVMADATRTACSTPDGTAVITADVSSLSFSTATDTNVCKLIVKNNNPGKKVTLKLPMSFGVSFTLFCFDFGLLRK